jgi:dolichol-phosphate mannosyltransferase
LLHAGKSLQFSQLAGFGAVAALYWAALGTLSLRTRSPACGWWTVVHLLAVAAAALLLRGAVLALLAGRCSWAPQFAIMLAAPAGSAVLLGSSAAVLSIEEPARRWQAFVVGLAIYSCACACSTQARWTSCPRKPTTGTTRNIWTGYLDHPPMVAWLIGTATAIFGQTEFAVRAGAILCGMLTSFFVYRLTRNIFGDAAALASLALTQALPFFFLSGLLMTPDSPLTAAGQHAFTFSSARSWRSKSAAWWRAGIALGWADFQVHHPVAGVRGGRVRGLGSALAALAAAIRALFRARCVRWPSLRRCSSGTSSITGLPSRFKPRADWRRRRDSRCPICSDRYRIAHAHRRIALALGLSFKGWTAWREDGQPGGGRRFLALATLLPLAVFFVFSLRHQVKLDWTGAPWVAAVAHLELGNGMGRSETRRLARLGSCRVAADARRDDVDLRGWAVLLGARGGRASATRAHIEILPVGWRDLSRQILASRRSRSGNRANIR